ncbi:MAG: STAS domain-containing protein [Gammaproteobacteria bacterium]|nr:STAS domain-containing protein [Gammaproteobacteria bacterium]
MNQAAIKALAPGRVGVQGVLTFYSVPAALRDSLAMFAEGDSLEVDLSGVTRSDSAGIALALEWTRMARQRNMTLRFVNVPSQMQSLAQVGGVDQLLAW